MRCCADLCSHFGSEGPKGCRLDDPRIRMDYPLDTPRVARGKLARPGLPSYHEQTTGPRQMWHGSRIGETHHEESKSSCLSGGTYCCFNLPCKVTTQR